VTKRGARIPASTPIKLSEAARRLGCHVETLRERIRRGQLEAIRGPHGAYWVRQDGLVGLGPFRKGRPIGLPPPLTTSQREIAWRIIELGLAELSADTELRFLIALQKQPELDPAAHRLATVHTLRTGGLVLREIAHELGISVRQASRLDHADLASGLRRGLLRFLRRAVRERAAIVRQERQLAIAELSRRLEAEGVTSHKLIAAKLSGSWAYLPKPARDQAKPLVARPDSGRASWRVLKDAGLDESQILAIARLGVSPDELNELMLRGLGPPAPAEDRVRIGP